MPTTILLARHGETDWNRDRRFQGRSDPPLNERGLAQARELAERMAHERIALIYSSPLRRAAQTAEIIASRLRLAVEPLDDLVEVDVGSWAGLTVEEIERLYPEAYREWTSGGTGWDGGETYEALGARVVAATRELAVRHAGERILVVTHGGPMRALAAHAAGLTYAESRRMSRRVENCGVLTLAVENGSIRAVD